MKILCVFGQYNYGDPARGEGYEYSNFLPALKKMSHEVELFDSFSRSQAKDFAELNRALLEQVQRFQPQLVFCVLMGYEIWLETLALLRKAGVVIVNWGTDDSWKYAQFSRWVAPACDRWATTSEAAFRQAQDDGFSQFVQTQWAASSALLAPPLPASECRYPVSFIGSAYGNRPRWVADLRARGIDVECFGHGWPNGAVAAADIPRIVRESVVSLNFGDSGLQWQGMRLVHNRQIKARVFEVPGAGGCLLTESAPGLEQYYRLGEEIETFDNLEMLVEKLQYLQAHPEVRDAIAQAGYRRTQREHTYEQRFAVLLPDPSVMQEYNVMNLLIFSVLAKKYQGTRLGHLLRAIYVWPFRLIWGERRGPRAARRVLFEVYWRLFGWRTYSAAGLPGKWFYRES